MENEFKGIFNDKKVNYKYCPVHSIIICNQTFNDFMGEFRLENGKLVSRRFFSIRRNFNLFFNHDSGDHKFFCKVYINGF